MPRRSNDRNGRTDSDDARGREDCVGQHTHVRRTDFCAVHTHEFVMLAFKLLQALGDKATPALRTTHTTRTHAHDAYVHTHTHTSTVWLAHTQATLDQLRGASPR